MNLIDGTQIQLKLIILNFAMNASVVGVCLLILLMKMNLVRSEDCCLEKTVKSLSKRKISGYNVAKY